MNDFILCCVNKRNIQTSTNVVEIRIYHIMSQYDRLPHYVSQYP